LARALAACGARRLILMGRSALPARETWAIADPTTSVGQRIAAVRALEAEGVAIHLATVDVSDESELRSFLDRYRTEAWPPICGVIHSVGELDDCLAHATSRERFDRMLAAKLRGAQHLDRLLPQVELFALMSSTAAFLAVSGQSSYAAANAGLDALARDRRARGLAAISIGWGVWEDTGLVKGAGGALKSGALRRQGVLAIPPARGAGLFGALCRSAEPSIAVLPIGWTAFNEARLLRRQPMFADNLDAVALQTRDLTAPDDAGAIDLNLTVRKCVGTVLKISPSRLDPRKALGEMGLTSLMAIELRNLLESSLRRPLSATLAWNHPTIEALIAHLGRDAAAPTAARPQETASPPAFANGELSALMGLSDEEALAALRNMSVAE
jgi:acyl carrier protein